MRTTLRLLTATALMTITVQAVGIAEQVDAVVKLFPAQSSQALATNAAKVIALGPTGIVELCRRLTPASVGNDTAVRYALDGTTTYAYRPGAEPERRMVAAAIAEAIPMISNTEVQAFLISQLQKIGGKESTSMLAKLLTNEKLYPGAAMALAAIGGKYEFDVSKLVVSNRQAAIAALNAVTQSREIGEKEIQLQCAALDAMGQVTGAEAMPELLAAMKSESIEVRHAAVVAACGIKTNAVVPALLAAASATNIPAETRARIVGELAARGDVQTAMLKPFLISGDVPVVLDAIAAVARRGDADTVPALVALTGHADASVRQAAGSALTRMQGANVVTAVADALQKAKPESCVVLLDVLSRRGPGAHTAVIMRMAANENASVRQAAIKALALTARGEDFKAVLDLLIGAKDEQERTALQSAAIAAGRRVADDGQRTKLLLAAQSAAGSGDARGGVLAVMAAFGNAEVLKAVEEDTVNSDNAARRAAIKALGAWRTMDAVPVLLRVAREPKDQTDCVLALRGAIDVAGTAEAPVQDKVARFREILAIDSSDDVKNRVQAQLKRLGINELPMPAAAVSDDGFTTLFNGRDLAGWIGDTKGYKAVDGTIVCVKGKGGRLFTARQYTNFVFRFEFKLEPGANNGLGIRTPLEGDPAYVGYEIQILEHTAPQYKDLKPWQYHGSIYGLVAAKREYLKPVGEWNSEEVIANGDHITVILNGTTIVDADVAQYKRPESGYIGFLGHGDQVSFRAIRIKELANVPPRGFVALFNGKDLAGWKGLAGEGGNPLSRARMKPEELAAAQQKADEVMRAHWSVTNDALRFDGGGSHLCTMRDYTNFELLVEWKIGPKGDSGIYLRGTPQVQIWDPAQWPEGSGGLYNNEKHPKKPLVCADRPIGQWNAFRIVMTGEYVSVWLNGTNVVDNVVLENYWDRSKPIFPSGQIELQSHGSELWFRNVFVREME